MTPHPLDNLPPLPGWGDAQPAVAASTSSLAAWSWYDLARYLAYGVAGGAAAVPLAALLTPPWLGHPGYGFRVIAYAVLLLVTALGLTAGLCLPEGHLRRAPEAWLRKAGRALAVAGAGAVLLAALLAAPAPAWYTAEVWLTPLLTWAPLGLLLGGAVAAGFPGERPTGLSVIAGLLAGILAAVLAWQVGGLLVGLPGGLGLLARQAAVLPAAGGVFGLLYAALRELYKYEWLQVVYGDQPGRHYVLTGAPFTLGAGPDCHLVLDAAGGVQPAHAEVQPRGRHTALRALSEEALVFRRDRRISVSELCDGDEIQIGETMLRYYRIH